MDVKVITRVYPRLRAALFHLTEIEFGLLKGGNVLRKGRRSNSLCIAIITTAIIVESGMVRESSKCPVI